MITKNIIYRYKGIFSSGILTGFSRDSYNVRKFYTISRWLPEISGICFGEAGCMFIINKLRKAIFKWPKRKGCNPCHKFCLLVSATWAKDWHVPNIHMYDTLIFIAYYVHIILYISTIFHIILYKIGLSGLKQVNRINRHFVYNSQDILCIISLGLLPRHLIGTPICSLSEKQLGPTCY